jgi:hypothetical protein
MGFPKLARLLGITLLLTRADAQVATSRIEGTVLDPSGAFVKGATIKARGESTGRQAAASSDERGLFVLPSLAPGIYELNAEAAGFRQEVVTGVEVRVGETATVRIGLQIGAPSESVTVKAEQSPVQLADAQGGGVVDQRNIDTLPQVERNPVRLAILQPGVQISAGTLGQSRINGTRQGSQAPRLDGVDVSEPITPGLGFIGVPASDSIQEFRVLTHSAKAEYPKHNHHFSRGHAGVRSRKSNLEERDRGTVAAHQFIHHGRHLSERASEHRKREQRSCRHRTAAGNDCPGGSSALR